MIDVSTAVPADLDAIDPMPIFEQEIPFLYRLKEMMAVGVAHTFKVKGRVIGVIGAVMTGEKEMTLWAWLSADVKLYKIEFAKKCKAALEFYESNLKPDCVYMYVKKDAKDVIRWGYFLGFHKSNLAKGLDGHEYYRMAKGEI